MDNLKNPLFIVAAIVIVIFAGLAWNYTEAIKAKNEIELQRIQSEERMEEAERQADQEQQQKEYVAKRKSDCLDIYETEGDKWNNVRGWRYDEEEDSCYIRYKAPNPKTEAECDELYPLDDKTWFSFNFHRNLLCKDGEFENSF